MSGEQLYGSRTAANGVLYTVFFSVCDCIAGPFSILLLQQQQFSYSCNLITIEVIIYWLLCLCAFLSLTVAAAAVVFSFFSLLSAASLFHFSRVLYAFVLYGSSCSCSFSFLLFLFGLSSFLPSTPMATPRCSKVGGVFCALSFCAAQQPHAISPPRAVLVHLLPTYLPLFVSVPQFSAFGFSRLRRLLFSRDFPIKCTALALVWCYCVVLIKFCSSRSRRILQTIAVQHAKESD